MLIIHTTLSLHVSNNGPFEDCASKRGLILGPPIKQAA